MQLPERNAGASARHERFRAFDQRNVLFARLELELVVLRARHWWKIGWDGADRQRIFRIGGFYVTVVRPIAGTFAGRQLAHQRTERLDKFCPRGRAQPPHRRGT